VDRTHWFKCEAWGKTAEIIANFITKGDLVLFDGVMVQETWNDKVTGQKRDKTLVKVERIHLLPNKRDGENQVAANPEVQETAKHSQTNQANPDKVPDDIPF
jgi:single-strand DNA-binding protein